MDLWKTYDCLHNDLWISKLEAYSLDKPSLNLVNDYLGFRKQRAKIGSSCSDWANDARGIPKGSILGSLLFNILINGISSFLECNFIFSFL